MDDGEIRLLSRKKRGIFALVFSRFAAAVLLILVQIVVFGAIYNWFSEYFKFFSIFQVSFSIVMVLYLFNCEMESSVKLTWLYLIMLFPVPTVFMLWLSRKDLGHRRIKRRIGQLNDESNNLIAQDEEVINNEDLIDSGTDDLCRYINRSGCFPIYIDTKIDYLPLGERKYERLLIELEKAEKFIFLEYFIIEEGYMWGHVLNVLARRAKEGVDVRVMYDGMCEAKLLTHDYPDRLAKLGIKCKPFTPIKPFLSTKYNYRDHRKIAVIDGRVAITGGVNLADEYINKVNRFGHWKDAAVLLEGKAVQSFTRMFLQMWNIDEKEAKWDEVNISYSADVSDGFVLPYADCPLDDFKIGENVYMDILYRAKTYVHIMTPYLILDNELENAIIYAAERGIDVRMILPGISDSKPADALAKSHYRKLYEAGVKIYEYTPGFVHSKVFVSDDVKAVVGTINLDYRSLYHHFECAAYLYKCACIKDIEEDFLETCEKCRLIDDKAIRRENLGKRLLGIFFKAIAPLL